MAAHVSLPCCLPTHSGLIFPPLAQGFSLCNSLFTSNLVKDRQHASELGLNGAQAFESLTSSWLQLWIWSNREQHAQQTPATFTWSRRDLYVHAFAERLYYAEHAKYRLLSIFRAIVKQKISIAEETVGDFSFSPHSLPWYSVFILFSLVPFVLLAYWSANHPLFHLYWNQLAEDKVHSVYLEPMFLRPLIIIFLHLSWEAASDLFSGSFHECLLSFTLNSGLFLSLPVPQNVDHMLALLCISVSEFVF